MAILMMFWGMREQRAWSRMVLIDFAERSGSVEAGKAHHVMTSMMSIKGDRNASTIDTQKWPSCQGWMSQLYNIYHVTLLCE